MRPEADLTRALYERYASQIYRYCLHQLGSREEAEDAVQSTFLNAFRGIRRGIVPVLESAWLFKIAHNVCLSRRRSTWRRDRIEAPAEFEAVEEVTPAPARRADELIGLQDVLGTMPENQRRAILLREWQGLSYREIAHELELSQAAVETLIFRARRSLARGLEQPPEPKRRRLVRGADLGNVLAGAKSLLLGGSAAVKVGAAVAIVGAGTVAATAPVRHAAPRDTHPVPAVHVTPSTPVATAPPVLPARQAPVRQAVPAPIALPKPKTHVHGSGGRHSRSAPAAPGQAKKVAAAPPGPATKSPPAPVHPTHPAHPAGGAHVRANPASTGMGNAGHGPGGKGKGKSK